MIFHNVSFLTNRRILDCLISVIGIGLHIAKRILYYFGYHIHLRLVELDEAELNRLLRYLNRYFVYVGNKVVRSTINNNIMRLCRIRTYRGSCHAKLLPVRGQRTHSNRYTQRKLAPQRMTREQDSTNYVLLMIREQYRRVLDKRRLKRFYKRYFSTRVLKKDIKEAGGKRFRYQRNLVWGAQRLIRRRF